MIRNMWMRFMEDKFYGTTDPGVSAREVRNQIRSRRIASEGMVLLENNGILPLQLEGRKIALFGNGARHTVTGGTGSGEVNCRTNCTVEQGLERAGATVTTKAWLDRYDEVSYRSKLQYMEDLYEKYADRPQQIFWSMYHFRNPLTIPVEEEDLAPSDEDIALYVLARHSGEGTDRRAVPGDYYLAREERDLLKLLCRHYRQIVVILNVGGVIDTEFFRSCPRIGAVLLMGQAGNTGGDALADVLSGRVTPCGHLTATWAGRYEDYPSADTFGHRNGDLNDEYYTEGIFVGYRWFDSFGKTPAYPFGYGKSYTSFETVCGEIRIEEGMVKLPVRVTNTGKTYAGREVAQVYVSAPAGKLEKPYQELVAYAKTETLNPGESCELTLSFSIGRMASYDEARSAWILEPGDYVIRLGEHSRSTRVAAVLRLESEILWEQLSLVLPLDCAMEMVSPDRGNYVSYSGEAEELAKAPVIVICESDLVWPEEDGKEKEAAGGCKREEPSNGCIGEETLPGDSGKNRNAAGAYGQKMWTMEDVLAGSCTLEELAEQLTVEELTDLCVGTARYGEAAESVVGMASTICPGGAGDTTSALMESRKIPNLVLADGPAGLRLCKSFTVSPDGELVDKEPPLGEEIQNMMQAREGKSTVSIPEGSVTHYQYCTAIPTATLLAQTWDPKALWEAGDIVGEEMAEFGIALWLAPGMNIHRNPLCGRNFEYYSEDPLISGICAAAETRGVQAHPGAGTTIKHFACNNQEDNRAYSISHVTERALREIYLKGFETAVKESQPMAIMSSYNLLNGIHTANSVDLLTKTARGEWGFEGLIMTDWGTTREAEPDEEGRLPLYGCSSAAACIKAGNDLLMPGSREDVDEIIASVGTVEESVECPLTEEELRECALHILGVVKRRMEACRK